MKCKMLRKLAKVHGGYREIGDIVDDEPECYQLVQMGVAEPADEECHIAAGMTAEAAQRAQAAYEKVSRGIQPEDYAAFDAGLMVGYDPAGNPIPGPNAVNEEEGDEDE